MAQFFGVEHQVDVGDPSVAEIERDRIHFAAAALDDEARDAIYLHRTNFPDGGSTFRRQALDQADNLVAADDWPQRHIARISSY